MHRIVTDLLAENKYDGEVRPNIETGQPVVCLVNFRINSMSALRETSMEYDMNIYLRLTWNDPRLSFSHMKEYENETYTLSHKQFEKLWIPDVFIKNEKAGRLHNMIVPNRLMRLFANGDILFSQRLSLSLACVLDLVKFPLDNQTCKVTFASYGHTTDDLEIIWDYTRWPTTISPSLDVPEFKLIDVTNHNCISKTSTGNFSCLEAILYFQRKMEYYLIQVYLPSSLVVVLSWLSFWIDIEAVPARISLGLLTVLTMSTQNSDFASQMPRLSYVKAVDVWMVMCLVFVFGALLEYALVNILARKQKPKQDKFLSALVKQATLTGLQISDKQVPVRRQARLGNSNKIEEETEIFKENCADDDKEKSNVTEKLNRNRAQFVDKFSRYAFPLSFGLFNLFYWIYYSYI
ncbi:DgyrCDS13109 [Dimorphilus gyrociliatus]|uniref:DgyrCDS13109 n=1 Tax=Dimorphilus gyrociliatus TaxID=2664684 RepID=A0A7I8W9N7_9ANNE|nr:DgyrCDS13109 [Dimorphilus gyrociliatus]